MSLEKYRDYVGIENMGYLYHEGVLAHYQSQLVEQVKEMDEYEKNTVYDSLVFETHLMHVKQVDFLDELTSTIERCIEYGFFQQLELVLEQLDRLVLMANHTDGVTMLDRRLLLRKLEMKCYCLAKSHGFIDAELEKRVTIFQRAYSITTGRDAVDTVYRADPRRVLQSGHLCEILTILGLPADVVLFEMESIT